MTNKCDVCRIEKEKCLYKCPRCNINYCSLNCYRDPIHSSCESNFRLNELSKIINLNENSTNLEEYEKIMSDIKEKTPINKYENRNIVESETQSKHNISASNDRFCSADFGSMKDFYEQLSPIKKGKFIQYLNTMTNPTSLNDNRAVALVVQPWWMILFRVSRSKPVELIGEDSTDESNRLAILSEIAPQLHPKLGVLSLEQMNKKAFHNYDKTLALIIHRLVLVYVASIRVYGNRSQFATDKSNMAMMRAFTRSLLSLVSPLVESDFKKIHKFYSTYEQLFENYEVDCLNYFQNDWNYASFTMSEQFFIQIYNDYILILNENYSETECTTSTTSGNSTSLHISLLYFVLSDVYDIFKKLSADSHSCSKYIGITKKLTFYLAWCKHYSNCDEFRAVLNFLQFRAEYLKQIVRNNQSTMSNEQLNGMRQAVRTKTNAGNQLVSPLYLDNSQ